MDLIKQLKAARGVGTPLFAITTTDQPGITATIVNNINGKTSTPILRWDRSRGYTAMNDYAKPIIKRMCDVFGCEPDELGAATSDPANAFKLAIREIKVDGVMDHVVPAHTIIIAQSMNIFLNEPGSGELVQAILNLRDPFKNNQRTLLMTSQDFRFPAEIQNDVILLDDPLPTEKHYGDIVRGLHEQAHGQKGGWKRDPEQAYVDVVVRSVRGLSGFEAEQVLSMSMALNPTLGKIDTTGAWDLKRKAVSKVPGLTMTLDGPPMSDLRDLDQIIDRFGRLWSGPESPELIVRVDEIDKSLAGLGREGGHGDNTGVTQDLLNQLLVNMEDNEWDGAILVGVRGAGKTVLSESIGKHYGVPTIAFDSGQMKGAGGGVVGTAEAAYRNAFRTIRGIGGKRVLILATCNKLDVIPAELLRRFQLGVWFFDVLSDEGRKALWPIYLKRYGLATQSLPDDKGWTGAEIRNCCKLAYKMNLSVKEVGETMIVPITQSDPQSVHRMQAMAKEKGFLSALHPGKYGTSEVRVEKAGKRKIALEEV